MTEDQKYEIATLAGEVARLRAAWERHMARNLPDDAIDQEKAFIDLTIARTEFFEAQARLERRQGEIILGRP